METGWVKVRGRRRVPGRPVTYGVTDEFLVHFGLESADALPGLEELRASGLLEALPASGGIPMPGEALETAGEDPLDENDDGREFLEPLIDENETAEARAEAVDREPGDDDDDDSGDDDDSDDGDDDDESEDDDDDDSDDDDDDEESDDDDDDDESEDDDDESDEGADDESDDDGDEDEESEYEDDHEEDREEYEQEET